MIAYGVDLGTKKVCIFVAHTLFFFPAFVWICVCFFSLYNVLDWSGLSNAWLCRRFLLRVCCEEKNPRENEWVFGESVLGKSVEQKKLLALSSIKLPG